jgi:serine/threonine protein kinase
MNAVSQHSPSIQTSESLRSILERTEDERDKASYEAYQLQKSIKGLEKQVEALSNLVITQESIHKTKLASALFGYFPSHPTNYSQLLGPVLATETESTAGESNIGSVIGDGNYAKVYIGTHQVTKQEVAIKVLPKNQLADLKILQSLEAELHILQFVDHPNCIAFRALLHAPDNIYVVMQRAHKDLYYFVYDASPSDMTMEIIRESIIGILLGLEYLHANGIAHMDIKPENVLVKEDIHPSGLRRHHIQLCDFGLGEVAANPDDHVPIRRFVGTPGFFAPEMAVGNQALDGTRDGRKADMWSVGCTMVDLTQGLSPEWMSAYTHRSKNANWMFKSRLTLCIQELNSRTNDQDLVRLIKNLLVLDPQRRISASESLAHPWIKSAAYSRHE